MKKITSSIIVIFLVGSMALLSGCYFAKSNNDAKITQASLNYLCEKYDANADEFELLDYLAPHIGWLPVGELIDKPKFVDYSFQYRYNEREFFVLREKGKFYDDYQLEDIQEWCTTLLQENVDDRIVGVRMETNDIVSFSKMENNIALEKEEAKSFLTIMNECFVYYYDDGVDLYKKQDIDNNDISLKIKEQLNKNAQSLCTSKRITVKTLKSNTKWFKSIITDY